MIHGVALPKRILFFEGMAGITLIQEGTETLVEA